MKIVPASIEIISTEPYEEMLKRIERAGRVCYKSEDKITEGSAEKLKSTAQKTARCRF